MKTTLNAIRDHHPCADGGKNEHDDLDDPLLPTFLQVCRDAHRASGPAGQFMFGMVGLVVVVDAGVRFERTTFGL